jgi:hypothetical protein
MTDPKLTIEELDALQDWCESSQAAGHKSWRIPHDDGLRLVAQARSPEANALAEALKEVERLTDLCTRARLLSDWSPEMAMTRASLMDELDGVAVQYRAASSAIKSGGE